MPKPKKPQSPILDRLDYTLAAMAREKMEPRTICLTLADQQLFDRAMSKQFKMKLACLAYRDIPIHRAGRSVIYSKQGVGRAVLKRKLP